MLWNRERKWFVEHDPFFFGEFSVFCYAVVITTWVLFLIERGILRMGFFFLGGGGFVGGWWEGRKAVGGVKKSLI